MRGVARDLLAGLGANARAWGPGAAALRLLREGRALGLGAAADALRASRSARRHLAAVGGGAPLFFLSDRHYLARGLPARARALAAVHHYGWEDALGPAYHAAMDGGGLLLWRACPEGARYEIRLCPGHDVMNEGGLSAVLFVDGSRVCVLSFSVVPGALVGAPRPVAGFVARKQLARDHGYQAGFNRAFDRATPAHLCLGALSGALAARGIGAAVGIAARRHPVWSPEAAATLGAAYDGFWATLDGAAGPFGTHLALPLRLRSVEGMDARRRKRALMRRAHVEAVGRAAAAAMAAAA